MFDPPEQWLYNENHTCNFKFPNSYIGRVKETLKLILVTIWVYQVILIPISLAGMRKTEFIEKLNHWPIFKNQG